MLKKLTRLYHTIKPLKREQIAYRLVYKLFPLKQLSNASFTEGIHGWKWQGPEVIAPSFHSESDVCYLNQKVDISKSTVWNDPAFEKLWLYNLHYFDDLNAVESLDRKEIQLEIVKRWIKENQPVSGNGWEPYPISLRLINWVKWYKRSEINDLEILASMLQQAEALSKQLEFHILGNHLFANAKALVFIGCFFQGKLAEKYLSIGLRLLDREIPEQFLDDGGHFELSPMYHGILLWDLLDLINLAQISKNEKLISRLSSWNFVATKALNWLHIMTHPDGEISFFNDATKGIAAIPSELQAYGNQLGIESAKSLSPLETLTVAGYSRISQSEYTLFFDHAEVGPSYLPGHAHADTLSIELSLGNERVLVNSGTSMYGISEERHRQRSTAAHNTVVVDNQNSSEVWGGFRVARRANCQLNTAKQYQNSILLNASHNGYMRLPGRVTHIREIKAEEHQIQVLDTLKGRYSDAVASFHLHPEIEIVKTDQNQITLMLKSGKSIKVISENQIVIESSTWHPEFGLSAPNEVLRIPVVAGKLNVLFSIQ